MSSEHFFTPQQAADEVGVDKSTILRALKGKSPTKLTGEKDKNGNWRIRPVELFRVYDKKVGDAGQAKEMPRHTSSKMAEELAEARIKIAELTAELKASEAISSLRETEMHKWQEQANRLALTDQSKSKTEATSQESLLEMSKALRKADARAEKAERIVKEVANQGFFTRMFKGTKSSA